MPHVRRQRAKPDAQPHPYKAQAPHEVWGIDGRQMDFTLQGSKWWSIVLLEGYSRTMLAAAVAPSETRWVAMLVLYTACRQYGAPQRILSDSGGAYISNECEAVCTRLEIEHITIVSAQGESWMNIMETHVKVQRRLYDYQFSLTQSPSEFEQVQQAFLKTYNTTAHAGLSKDGFATPIPLVVLGDAKGRRYSEDALAQKFSRALFPRTRRIAMAVCPCIMIIAMWQRAYHRRRCCCGCMRISSEQSWTASCWRRTTAAMRGTRGTGAIFAMASGTPPALTHPKGR